MKGIRTRLLLVAFLALCLAIAAPARTHEDTSEMSRADLLLLQDTVARHRRKAARRQGTA